MIYLLRVNLDIEDKDLGESDRFLSAVGIVKSLTRKGNKVVVVSHFGRPKGFDPKLSLGRFRAPLEKKLGMPVLFFGEFDFKKIKKVVSESKKTRVFLLENIRFVPGEEKNSPVLAKQLASLADRYMNDDFATSHRSEASISGVAKFLPSKPGPTLLREVSNLRKVMTRPRKPFILIIGGAKMKDKIGVVKKLIPLADKVLLGGGAANTFLKARGIDIGSSISDNNSVSDIKKLAHNKKIILPIDCRRSGKNILDIGPKTVRLYRDIIKKSGTVVWGGPMGRFEDKRFSSGSYGVARAIAASSAFSVVGGAETDEVITRLGLQKKINLVSTGGGAMLAYLAHQDMPGLKALKIRY